ncbi:MAG: rod shape-determining protein MreC [Dehalococcoidia bacterium]
MARWLLLVSLLGVAGLAVSALGLDRPLQSGAQRITEPLSALVNAVTEPVAGLVAGLSSQGRLRRENSDLLIENERLRSELARMREDEIRTASLDELLNLGNRIGSDQLTYAAIVARAPGPVRDVVAITRGTRDGVYDGMPVLGRGGALVGTVERSLDSTAWVRLITDPQSGVNAVVQESRAPALAVGAADHRLRMDYLPQGAVVKTGDTVVTSGLGGSYPPGLLVGRVARVEVAPTMCSSASRWSRPCR